MTDQVSKTLLSSHKQDIIISIQEQLEQKITEEKAKAIWNRACQSAAEKGKGNDAVEIQEQIDGIVSLLKIILSIRPKGEGKEQF